MPRLPKVVKIGAHTYELLQRKRVVLRLKGKQHGKHAGKCVQVDGCIDYDNERIYVDTRRNTGINRHLVLWHEIFHGMAASAGWKYNEAETEEMSKVIVQVLVDNPGVIPPARKH